MLQAGSRDAFNAAMAEATAKDPALAQAAAHAARLGLVAAAEI
jgi:hypothetical protein